MELYKIFAIINRAIKGLHCSLFLWTDCVWVRFIIYSPISNIHVWDCVFSAYPFPLWWLREYTLCLIVIIKSEVWTTCIIHCLGLGHQTMVCAVCLSLFLLWQLMWFQWCDSIYTFSCFFLQISLEVNSLCDMLIWRQEIGLHSFLSGHGGVAVLLPGLAKPGNKTASLTSVTWPISFHNCKKRLQLPPFIEGCNIEHTWCQKNNCSVVWHSVALATHWFYTFI